MKKIYVLLLLLLITPFLYLGYKHVEYLFISVGNKPEFIFNEDSSDLRNYIAWTNWIAQCEPPIHFWYNSFNLQMPFKRKKNIFEYVIDDPRYVYERPRKGCPPYNDWLVLDKSNVFGYSDIPIKGSTRVEILNLLIKRGWISSHHGLYKKNVWNESIPLIVHPRTLDPLSFAAQGSLSVVLDNSGKYIYPLEISLVGTYAVCPQEIFQGLCNPVDQNVELRPYWVLLNRALNWGHLTNEPILSKDKVGEGLKVYLSNGNKLVGLNYMKSLAAYAFNMKPLESVKVNQPFKAIYFTGPPLKPDSWVRCQHIKTPDFTQPLIVKQKEASEPTYANLNACLTQVKINEDVTARVRFQYEAMAGMTLEEFIANIKEKLVNNITTKG